MKPIRQYFPRQNFPLYSSYTTVPFTDNPHLSICSFVNVLLHCSPLATKDIPLSPILLWYISSSCSELLTFNNSLRQLAPVVTVTMNIMAELEITVSH